MVLIGAASESPHIDAHFTYRHTKAYAIAARERLPNDASVQGLRLPDMGQVRQAASRVITGPPLRAVQAITYGVPFRQAVQVLDILWLWRVFRRSRCDIVHINNGGFPGAASCNAAAVAARLARVPVVVYVVNNIAAGYRHPLRWADYVLDRLTARSVTQFVTGSEEAASALRGVLRLPPERVVTMHNGIAVRLPSRSPEVVRADLDIPPDAVLVAVVARLEKRKGHRYLVDALAHLARHPKRVDWVLVVEGIGPEEESLRAQVMNLKLGPWVRFVGHASNVWDLYSAADIVVLPSIDHEDFPNVTLEAMASAKPVIASSLAGTTEQVVDGETGFLVPPAQVKALADALDRLIGDKDARERMGKAGSVRFHEEFSAAAATDRYWSLYKRLTAGRQ